MAKLLFILGLLGSLSAQAGMKEDFIDAVVKQCALTKEKAEEFATPGRTGNVVKFTVCSEASLDVGSGCKITCTKSGSTIGG